VRLSSPGPILFRQFRVGRDGQEFAMFKFRSMRVQDGTERPEALPPLPDAAPGGVEGGDRRTRFGSFIRSTSLDELPQLFNAGITGWAQVHGLRGQTHLADRVDWDNYYIENWSLWLDLKILLLTFSAVARGAE
jgi:lipopolysaccharide/colanic/teichoic acid biosynthesis glycosyltransferase